MRQLPFALVKPRPVPVVTAAAPGQLQGVTMPGIAFVVTPDLGSSSGFVTTRIMATGLAPGQLHLVTTALRAGRGDTAAAIAGGACHHKTLSAHREAFSR